MSVVKIIFHLVRNGRHIFPDPSSLSFPNTSAVTLRRGAWGQLQRAAVGPSVPPAPLPRRLYPTLCLFSPCSSLKVPAALTPGAPPGLRLCPCSGSREFLPGVPLISQLSVVKKKKIISEAFLSYQKQPEGKQVCRPESSLLLPPRALPPLVTLRCQLREGRSFTRAEPSGQAPGGSPPWVASRDMTNPHRDSERLPQGPPGGFTDEPVPALCSASGKRSQRPA